MFYSTPDVDTVYYIDLKNVYESNDNSSSKDLMIYKCVVQRALHRTIINYNYTGGGKCPPKEWDCVDMDGSKATWLFWFLNQTFPI